MVHYTAGFLFNERLINSAQKDSKIRRFGLSYVKKSVKNIVIHMSCL